MILAPTVAPPSSFPINSPGPHTTLKTARTVPPHVSVPPSTTAPVKNTDDNRTASQNDALSRLKIPAVVLDTPTISHSMAATVALSLLGHILFLKSQVPFPVVQMARMPGGPSDARAAKRRTDLLSAMDTLTSHMHTTFSALSTALARRKSKGKDRERGDMPERAPAHLAFVLGPSVGAARARVVLVVDGLEVRIWGQRDDACGASKGPRRETAHDDGASEEERSEDEGDEGDEEDAEREDGDEEGSDEESEALSIGDSVDGSESEAGSEPPISRSPSPSPPSSDLQSRSPSPCNNQEPGHLSSAPFVNPPPHPVRVAPSSTQSQAQVPQTHAEEQQVLRAAERLLSRTLAHACAEEGGGMSCELAPTQTHVLLRAPRRFAHPAWLPRQNLTRTMEGVLHAFLEDAGCVSEPAKQSKKKSARKGAKTEGVWLGCKGSSATGADMAIIQDEAFEGKEDDEVEEDDEMIWWVWDGKIVGFADW
ncbi:hypothetical protein AcV5_003741 [Taiwanofungus camphoratus]|nr:hypothetical protein AcV5_003741 [Antrodia cinnamomea]